jgi:hypothetical protein
VILMREIKFRGIALMSTEELDVLKIDHKNGWVYGNLVMDGNEPYIVGDLLEATDDYIIHEFWVRVIPETVGQCTGFKDDWDVDIYEYDIVKDPDGYLWVVLFKNGSWVLSGGEYDLEEDIFEFVNWNEKGKKIDVLVVGNWFDSQELMEEQHG